jgi:hypothetical protein
LEEPLPAEKYVLESVSAGQPANLAQRFKKRDDRRLRADFLEGLLTKDTTGLKVHRHGLVIEDCIVEGDLDLYGVRVPFETQLIRCEFQGRVNLARSDFSRYLSFRDSVFTSRRLGDFAHLKAEDDIILDGATFAGPVNFGYADIRGMFSANEVHFNGAESRFEHMKVDGDALFKSARFAGPAIFWYSKITGQLVATWAHFGAQANFLGATVGPLVSIEGAEFAGPLEFSYARIGGQIIANCARFSQNSMADFAGVVVADKTSLSDHACSGSAVHPAAGGTAAQIPSLNFDNAQLLNLEIEGRAVGELRLSGAVLQRGLLIKDTQVQSLFGSSLQVLGDARLLGVKVTNEMDLSHAKFLGLTLDHADSMFQGKKGKLLLEGMDYEKLSGGANSDASENFLKWIAMSPYSAETYSRLEGLLKDEGYTGSADKVYKEMRTRERHETLPEGSGKWWTSLFLSWVVGYGREPQRALYYVAVLVIIGILVFRRNDMVEQKKESAHFPFSAFWYSLDLLTPFIDLEAANLWAPKVDYQWGRFYARAHRILGWILVPICLAALTGLVK